MRKFVKLVVALLPALFATAASSAESAEWKAVFPRKVGIVKIEERCFLLVTGLLSSSAQKVQRVVLSEEREAAHIEISMSPLVPDGSGSFHVVVPLEFPTVRRVTFGPDKVDIWRSDNKAC